MYASSLLFFTLVSSVASQYYCPGNVSYFDLNPCDKDARNQCPCGYGCRPATVIGANTTFEKYICCETRSMIITQCWFELNLLKRILDVSSSRGVRCGNLRGLVGYRHSGRIEQNM
ncbi:hypothetical protein L596_001125 [Steinernema carpocapsae]|uniref:Uncharacterized protein n=1 Tax=Steinernema carpocapsae TaxID=34508 RepID=A0A4U8UKN5_STECR|nr:hypothetical protein L596_001125 [Steinernema carpocapsae]